MDLLNVFRISRQPVKKSLFFLLGNLLGLENRSQEIAEQKGQNQDDNH